MANTELLSNLQSFLHENNIDCSLHEKTESIPLEHLLVFLGHDSQLKERVMAITAQRHTLNNTIDYIHLQYIVALPLLCSDSAIGDISHLLHFLNRQIELPGFELDEVNNSIIYRHVAINGPTLDNHLVHATIGIITMILDLLSDPITQVAEGKVSFDTLLKEAAEVFSSMN